MPDNEYNPSPKLNKLEVGADLSGGMFSKNGKLGAFIFVTIIALIFGSIGVRVNLEQARPKCESLSPEVRAKLAKLPVGTNVIVYLGMNEIRSTDFWKTFLPDSIKNRKLSADTSAYGQFVIATGFNFTTDTESAIYAAASHSEQDDHQFITIISGKFDPIKTSRFFSVSSTDSIEFENHKIYKSKSDFYSSQISREELVLSGDLSFIKNYLKPKSDFFKSDTLLTPLIERTQYKSQAWAVLGSTQWALGALKGLTSSNQDLSSNGNISKVQQLLFSIKLSDGIIGQSEWIYRSRTSAYFAGGLINFALWISEKFSQRQSEDLKKVIAAIDLTQNLESLMFRAELSRPLLEEIKK